MSERVSNSFRPHVQSLNLDSPFEPAKLPQLLRPGHGDGFELPRLPPIDINPPFQEDVKIERFSLCNSLVAVHVECSDRDQDILVKIHADGSSTMYVNGQKKADFTKEETERLTIRTGGGNDKVTFEDDRAFQDQHIPVVEKNGPGQARVILQYPGLAPMENPPLRQGEKSI
ncbi:MAG: hypothetical protein IPJ65_28730 [Archangiaceae bacterium]|nr:hypothetical protein [Archangiaceae bacterium]